MQHWLLSRVTQAKSPGRTIKCNNSNSCSSGVTVSQRMDLCSFIPFSLATAMVTIKDGNKLDWLLLDKQWLFSLDASTRQFPLWALPVMGDGNWNTNQADKKPGADQSEQGFIPQFKAGLSTVTLWNWTPNLMANEAWLNSNILNTL